VIKINSHSFYFPGSFACFAVHLEIFSFEKENLKTYKITQQAEMEACGSPSAFNISIALFFPLLKARSKSVFSSASFNSKSSCNASSPRVSRADKTQNKKNVKVYQLRVTY